MLVQKNEIESGQFSERLENSFTEDQVEFVKSKSKEIEKEKFSLSDLTKLKELYRCTSKSSPYYKKLELIREYVLLFWQCSKLKDMGLVALLDGLACDLIVKNWMNVDITDMKKIHSGIAQAMDDHLKSESKRICGEFIENPNYSSSLDDLSFKKLCEDHAEKSIGDRVLVQNIEKKARKTLLRIFKNIFDTEEVLKLEDEIIDGWIIMMKHSPAYISNVPSLARYCWELSVKKAGQYGVLPIEPLIRSSLKKIIEEWRNNILPEDREYSKNLRKNLERFLIEFMYQQMNKQCKIYGDIYVSAIKDALHQRSPELKKYLVRIQPSLADHVYSELLVQLRCEESIVTLGLKECATNMVKEYKGARVKHNATKKNHYDRIMEALFKNDLLLTALGLGVLKSDIKTAESIDRSLAHNQYAYFSGVSPKAKSLDESDNASSELPRQPEIDKKIL